MNDEIKKVISESSFTVHDGRFVYARVSKAPSVDKHFMVTRDSEEITVVTKEENSGELAVIEQNKDVYALIALNVSVPFYSVGFLAAVSEAVAKEGMNILIVSTFSKDYIMVRYDKLDVARSVLTGLGFMETEVLHH